MTKTPKILTMDEVHELLNQGKRLKTTEWDKMFIFKSGDKIVVRCKSFGGIFKDNLEDSLWVECNESKDNN